MIQILYFTSTGCQPCRTLGPIMESLKNHITYRKLDIDIDENLVIKFKVRSVPTLILVENGVEKNRLVGVHQAPEILRFYHGVS